MAANEPANAPPGDAPGSDAINPAGDGDLGPGRLEALAARLAAMVSRLMESRAPAAYPNPSMPPPRDRLELISPRIRLRRSLSTSTRS
jgi:hypothetical protein